MSDDKPEVTNEIQDPNKPVDMSKVGQWTIPPEYRAPKPAEGPAKNEYLPPEPPPYKPPAPHEVVQQVDLSKMPTLSNPNKSTEAKLNPLQKLGNILRRGK